MAKGKSAKGFWDEVAEHEYDGLLKARFERGQPKGIRIGRDLRVLMISLGALLNLPFLTLSFIAGIMNAETVRRIVIARREEPRA